MTKHDVGGHDIYYQALLLSTLENKSSKLNTSNLRLLDTGPGK